MNWIELTRRSKRFVALHANVFTYSIAGIWIVILLWLVIATILAVARQPVTNPAGVSAVSSEFSIDVEPLRELEERHAKQPAGLVQQFQGIGKYFRTAP